MTSSEILRFPLPVDYSFARLAASAAAVLGLNIQNRFQNGLRRLALVAARKEPCVMHNDNVT